MAQELTVIASHSPRVRTNETAEHFLAGFSEVAKKHGIRINFVRGKKVSEKGLSRQRQYESLTESSVKAGKPPIPSERLEEELEKINRGEKSEYLLSKEEMLAPEKMGLMLTRSRLASKLARRLYGRGLPAFVKRLVRWRGMKMVKIPKIKSLDEIPTLISIFLRHSRNKGDKLTDEGIELAKEQGRKTAEHLIEHFLKDKTSLAMPTIVLNVSHGGGKTPGQLDWVFEHKDVMGKPVKEFGGPVSHAEGLITLGYGDGRIKRLFLRQHGITHLN